MISFSLSNSILKAGQNFSVSLKTITTLGKRFSSLASTIRLRYFIPGSPRLSLSLQQIMKSRLIWMVQLWAQMAIPVKSSKATILIKKGAGSYFPLAAHIAETGHLR